MSLRVHEENVLVATRSFEAVVDGKPFVVTAGVTRVRDDDPLVKLHPDAWRKATGTVPSVETMTREPGE